ncbi:MAG: hypothetical protein ABSG07_18930 [Terriglobales bacterium]|jgi:prepilin signal peptidase PulO-like enzyme (type II secretory pathway)
MNAPNNPERVPEFVAQSSLVTQLPAENLATLTRMDFQILLDGEVNEVKSGRDLCLGILGSAVIGLIGLVATIDWDTAFHQARKTPFVWTALLFAIALASACGALIYQVRYQKTHASSAYSTLIKRLADHFAKR